MRTSLCNMRMLIGVIECEWGAGKHVTSLSSRLFIMLEKVIAGSTPVLFLSGTEACTTISGNIRA